VDRADAGRASGTGLASGARRIPAEVWEARRAAREILGEAQEAARRLRGEAEAEAATARAAAVEAGRSEGLARAAAEVVRGAGERDRLLAGCAGELIGLAVEMAERILSREVRPGADALAAAGRALTELRGGRRLNLRASPTDAEAIRSAAEAGEASSCVIAPMRLTVDPDLAPGEVIVEADGAAVDGRFRSQLLELRRALEEAER
jgi:flagellar biosynthesis/type III secretory pathway protein FliH